MHPSPWGHSTPLRTPFPSLSIAYHHPPDGYATADDCQLKNSPPNPCRSKTKRMEDEPLLSNRDIQRPPDRNLTDDFCNWISLEAGGQQLRADVFRSVPARPVSI
ncbi:hypothetical protein CDAR_228761 [Caerostris darwini]|uniref:Uncharacterized protein n=1 Tax=Caerostris darwini TaxID=1538125 RepID=A0AAV4PH71_9ARAC|nr:hypothetical protein CDAR_228761 [Caerostris darwini]